MTIQLSVEEALEYQKFDSELVGFIAGVSASIDFFRRRKIDSIVMSRKPAEPPKPEEKPNGIVSQ